MTLSIEYKWKKVGIIALAISLILLILAKFDIILLPVNKVIFVNVVKLVLYTSLIAIAYSKEKVEDEKIVALKNKSLQYAFYIVYAICVCFAFNSSINNKGFSITGDDLYLIASVGVISQILLFYGWSYMELKDTSKENSAYNGFVNRLGSIIIFYVAVASAVVLLNL